MDKFIVKGPTPLNGDITISGSKNAVLPLLAAALLADEPMTLNNIPRLQDIYTFNNVLRVVGANVQFQDTENRVIIDPSNVNYLEAPYDLVRKMRASFYMLGALVGKHGYAKVSMPGGCAWGPRPVDLHLKGMKAMGIAISLDKGYVIAKAGSSVPGGRYRIEPISVGATINLLLAAVLRAESFTIENAAKEPDVVQLCNVLNKMGANISGVGSDTLSIKQVQTLSGGTFQNDPDRIEAGTFMIAAAMLPESSLRLIGCNAQHLGNFPELLRQTGAKVDVEGEVISVQAPEILQPVLSQADGSSTVTDTVYFDRFSYVPELSRLGANIKLKHNTAYIEGPTLLEGASVMSTDLRASVSLVLAAMAAKNTSEILRVYHLDRGYESLEDKLTAIGAKLSRAQE